MGNIHNGYTNGESSSPNFNQNPVNNQTRPLSHLHSGNSVDSGDEVPQRPALAVNQHDERDSSAASNSTGASSNFSSTGNEPATSGDSTTTHDTNCIPTLKTIGLDQENSDNKQNTRSRSNQEFSTNRHQHMTEQQRRTQSLDNKTYPTIQKHILQKASSGSSSAFTPNPIHPLSFYPFPNFNNLNSSNNSNPNNNNNHHMNQISLPPLSVPHQPLPQASFIPQMTPHFPQQNFDGLLPIITKGTGASSITTISGTPYGDEVHPIQRSDLTSVSTLALAKSSPGLPGLTHIAATPMKFPPNPTSILKTIVAGKYWTSNLSPGRPPKSGNITAGVTGATGGTPISNPTQIGNSNWGPSQNRGAFISSLPPPSQLLNSASYSGTNRNVSQQLELKADGSSSQSAQDHHFAPRPRDL